jgi:RNA polymerase sigma factor for flagellar operon FliA
VAEQRTNDYLEQAAASEPPDRSAGSSLEHTISEIGEHLANVAMIQRVGVDVETMEDPAATEQATGALEERQEAERLREALDVLPEKERKLIESAYFQEKSLTDAGAELGLSRSWASRLHARAIERLRKRLQATA